MRMWGVGRLATATSSCLALAQRRAEEAESEHSWESLREKADRLSLASCCMQLLLVQVGLCALLFGRVKHFRRGGGSTPNLEKQILLETGVRSFNRREIGNAFKVIWDPTYISTYVDSFARHSLFSDKVCHRTWSRHLSTFETLRTYSTYLDTIHVVLDCVFRNLLYRIPTYMENLQKRDALECDRSWAQSSPPRGEYYFPIDPIPNLSKIDPKWNVNIAMCVCNVMAGEHNGL